ncbi:MAG: HlyD family type I secretion periplasmic adaptor subunit [Alphaproteobacteria bacterium]
MSEAASAAPGGDGSPRGRAVANRAGPPAAAAGVPAKRPATPPRYVEFLPDVEAVAHRRHSPYARWLLLTIAVMFAAIVAWAALTEVEQYASANGQVRPDGRVKIVNHPFGGTITEVLVDEGDLVDAGQVLFRLDPEFVEGEITGIRGQWLTALAALSRLQAEADGADELVFPDSVLDEAPDAAANQYALFDARRDALITERNRADQVVAQRREAITQLESEIAKLQASLAIVSEQERSVRALVEQDYFPELRWLSLKREVEELTADVASAEARRASAEAALNQAQAERTAIDEARRSEILAELAETRSRAETLAAQLAVSQTEQARLTITAPERGIVQNLAVTNIGQSIAPNEPLLNIVPVGDTLIVEASVGNADIGFIEVGMPADVKVVTYDFARYGSLAGVVTEIAPDATVDPNTGVPYFKVWVRTERTYLGEQPGQYPVLPGMQTIVDLEIGRRTVLEFLTERITRTTSEAFTER